MPELSTEEIILLIGSVVVFLITIFVSEQIYRKMR